MVTILAIPMLVAVCAVIGIYSYNKRGYASVGSIVWGLWFAFVVLLLVVEVAQIVETAALEDNLAYAESYDVDVTTDEHGNTVLVKEDGSKIKLYDLDGGLHVNMIPDGDDTVPHVDAYREYGIVTALPVERLEVWLDGNETSGSEEQNATSANDENENENENENDSTVENETEEGAA